MIYSAQLYTAATLPTSLTTVYTAPANSVVVVRDVEYYNYSGVQATLAINIGAPGSNGLVLFDTVPASVPSRHWEGRVVLAPNGTILISSSSASFAVTISGYVLT